MTHCWLVASHLIEKIVQVNIVWRIVLLKLQNVAEKLVHLRSSFQQVRIKKLCRLADGLKLGFFHFFLIANALPWKFLVEEFKKNEEKAP